jgi:hypothetical protein
MYMDHYLVEAWWIIYATRREDSILLLSTKSEIPAVVYKCDSVV